MTLVIFRIPDQIQIKFESLVDMTSPYDPDTNAGAGSADL